MRRILIATLAVLLLLSGCEHDEPVATPQEVTSGSPERPTYDGLPEGPATRLPWWEDGVLHVDGTKIPTRLRGIEHRGGTTLVGRSRFDRAEWHLVRDGRLVPLVSGDSPINPVLAPDGHRVVWTEVDRGVQRLTAYDVASGSVAGTWTTTEPVSSYERMGAVGVLGVGLDGRVRITGLDGREFWTAIWTPGHEPVRRPGQGRYRQPDLDGLRSVDGRPVRVSGPAGGWEVVDREGGRTGLRMPGDVRYGLVAWESPTAVLFEARGHRSRVGLVRCDAETGACERVADGPGARAVLPDPYA